jgi:hypothetical protein
MTLARRMLGRIGKSSHGRTDMKRILTVMLATFALSTLDGCGSSDSGGAADAGHGGANGSGGANGTGGTMGAGGKVGTGGQSGGGATGTSTQTGLCPYTVASFTCEAACKKLHDFTARCENDPAVPSEIQGMLGIYGKVEVICTSSCAVVAPSSQAQWSCFQGMPDDAPCSAIGGCNATNCP